jgi:hypothetical protein
MASESVSIATPSASSANPEVQADDNDVVDPWNVKATDGGGGIDYNKLIEKFGSTRIDQVLIFTSPSLSCSL